MTPTSSSLATQRDTIMTTSHSTYLPNRHKLAQIQLVPFAGVYKIQYEPYQPFSVGNALQWRHNDRNLTIKVFWALYSLNWTIRVVQAQFKENIKARRHWPLWGESSGDRWIPLTKDH